MISKHRIIRVLNKRKNLLMGRQVRLNRIQFKIQIDTITIKLSSIKLLNPFVNHTTRSSFEYFPISHR